MSQEKFVNRPSNVYVFVVLSLAAFLALFTCFRKPGMAYQTQVTFRPTEAGEGPFGSVFLSEFKSEIHSKLLAPEFILDAMRHADLIESETSPETLSIAEEIANRMQVRVREMDAKLYGRVELTTERPEAGIKLLDSMMRDMPSLQTCNNSSDIETHAAAITRPRGGSVNRARLLQLWVASGLFGLLGVVWASRNGRSVTLQSGKEVSEVSGLPVIADFSLGKSLTATEQLRPKRRSFGIVLRAAELAVAAVFLVMVFNLITRDALATRFVDDPLAAYGEVLTNIIS